MAESASLYFGQDSYGLVRTPPIREGHIHLGEPKVLSVVDDEANQRAAESSAALASMIGDWPGHFSRAVTGDPAHRAKGECRFRESRPATRSCRLACLLTDIR